MGTNYEKLYQETPDALGNPSKVFVEFFEALPQAGISILDIGCGQGRDAIFIARLGHLVTGVDVSPSGISGMIAASTAENLNISGIVADIREFNPENQFDVVLVDRTLHMLDREDRTAVLKTLVEHIELGGFLLIADEKSNMSDYREVLDVSARSWQIIRENNGYLFVKDIQQTPQR